MMFFVGDFNVTRCLIQLQLFILIDEGVFICVYRKLPQIGQVLLER